MVLHSFHLAFSKTSFIFSGAASLHYHHEEIEDCLETYLSKRNMKIQTVLADSKDETIDCHLVALGLVYFRITGKLIFFKQLIQCTICLWYYKTCHPNLRFIKSLSSGQHCLHFDTAMMGTVLGVLGQL